MSPAEEPAEEPLSPGAGPGAAEAFPLLDLEEALAVALARSDWLLSAGEVVLVRRFQACSEPARALYARLRARRARVFDPARLDYAEVPEASAAVDELRRAGLALPRGAPLPVAWLAETHTVAELKALLARLGRRRGGRRAELVARLDDPEGRALLAERDALVLCGRALFRRLLRLYLLRGDADLSRAVVERLGLRTWPRYTPSGGEPPFPTRGRLLAWEQSRRRWHLLDGEGLLAELPAALDRVRQSPVPPPHLRRFRARHYDERICAEAARGLERAGEHAVAAEVYEALLGAGVARRSEVAVRLAQCRDRLGDPAGALAACREALESARPAERLALVRTGRRLARKAGRPWVPLPPLRRPARRELSLPGAEGGGSRPLYRTSAGPRTVEPAVVDWLAARGRPALFGESSPWRTLFGLLAWPLLFAPVPDALPSPWLNGPLDYGTPRFREARREDVAAWLAQLRAGRGAELLEAALAEHGDEAIVGVDLGRVPPPVLGALVEGLSGPALAGILEAFVDQGGRAARGLPDLCLLPGPALHAPEALPHRVGTGLLLVEVKGPGDSLRDEQRVWLDRLARLGVPAEVWEVARTPPEAG